MISSSYPALCADLFLKGRGVGGLYETHLSLGGEVEGRARDLRVRGCYDL